MATQTICDRCGKVIDDGESMSRFTLDVAACILDGEGGWLLQDGPHDKDLCEGCTIKVYEFSTKTTKRREGE